MDNWMGGWDGEQMKETHYVKYIVEWRLAQEKGKVLFLVDSWWLVDSQASGAFVQSGRKGFMSMSEWRKDLSTIFALPLWDDAWSKVKSTVPHNTISKAKTVGWPYEGFFFPIYYKLAIQQYYTIFYKPFNRVLDFFFINNVHSDGLLK